MQRCLRFFVLSFLAVSTLTTAHAQITNFTVNGDTSSNQSFVTGSVVTWQYNIPAGTTVNCELWYDINQNGVIDTATDFNYFKFTQTDGDTVGQNGPNDQDGLVNGHVIFSQEIGLAPGKFVFKISQNSSVVIRKFTVTALVSPAHTISGTVTPPSGKSAQWILVDFKQQSEHDNNKFWDTFTDVNGNFAVQMDADTSGNPWRLRLGQDGATVFPPSIQNPTEYDITVVNASYTGYTFTFTAPAAKVTGYLKDENGSPINNANMNLARQDQNNLNYNTNTDQNGYFEIGIEAGDLDGASWNVAESFSGNGNGGGQNTTGYMYASANLGVIASGDSVFRNLISYSTNSTLSGQARFNGSPVNFPLFLFAATQGDSGYSTGIVDSTTGDFSIPVSDKVYNYNISLSNPPPGLTGGVSNAHPGAHGLILYVNSGGGGQQVTFGVNLSWNLVSVPVQEGNMQKTSLFSAAVSNAFAFQNGYITKETLSVGTGYWLKFDSSQQITLTGGGTNPLTVPVGPGWNLIGSISNMATFENVTSNPDGLLSAAPFFYGPTGYTRTDTLWPGRGYWLKSSGSGSIMISAPSVAAKKGTVRAVPHGELLKK